MNNKHRDFFQYMRDFYFENIENINMIQQSYGIGTDQTPLNYNLTLQNIDVKLLPYRYNMSCMPKKEILAGDMLHTKLGWVMHFNGLPDKDKSVPFWMKKTFEYLCSIKRSFLEIPNIKNIITDSAKGTPPKIIKVKTKE